MQNVDHTLIVRPLILKLLKDNPTTSAFLLESVHRIPNFERHAHASSYLTPVVNQASCPSLHALLKHRFPKIKSVLKLPKESTIAIMKIDFSWPRSKQTRSKNYPTYPINKLSFQNLISSPRLRRTRLSPATCWALAFLALEASR